MAEVADRVCYGGAYGRLPPPPSVFQKIPSLGVQARSKEALLRKTRTSPSWPRRGRMGLRRRRGAFSHGGNRSYGGRAFAASLNSFYCRRRSWRPRPGPSGNTARRWREDEELPQGRSSDRQWLQESGAASEHRGGRRDRRQLSWVHNSGSRTPPSIVTLTHSRHSRLTLGGVYTMSRPVTT